jgi:hypothetical protein
VKKIGPLIVFFRSGFTPLESPSVYAGGGRIRKHQLLDEGRVKTLPFLTGFTKPKKSLLFYAPPSLFVNAKLRELQKTNSRSPKT